MTVKKIASYFLLLGLLLSMAAASGNKSKKEAAPAVAADNATEFNGWVSDEVCKTRIDASCSKQCVAAGHKLLFVNADKKLLAVANQDSLKPFIGQHVNIKGKLENGVLTVVSVKAIVD